MIDQITVERLRDFLGAWNRHDPDEIASFFAEDGVFETPRGDHPWGTRVVGRAPIRDAAAARFAAIPDLHYSDDAHWVCGENAVSSWTVRGTPVDGPPLHVRGCDLLDVRDGEILRKDSYWKLVG
jgi:ketosteroid isomerase-like protein